MYGFFEAKADIRGEKKIKERYLRKERLDLREE